MPTTLEFNRIDKVILAPISATGVTCQEIYDQCRNYEDEPANLDLQTLVAGSGKSSLGGGRHTGITVELVNDWRLQFAAREEWTLCWVTGGNLIATNQYDDSPIKPSAYVNAVIAQSTEAALLEGDAVWTSAEQSQIRDALGVDGDKTAATDGQLQAAAEQIEFIRDVDAGRWKIVGNQMVFYKGDNVTEIARFDLLDEDGEPADGDVFERVRV